MIGQRHGDDRIGRMLAPEQIVCPAVLVLGIARVDPRTDDLVPFDGPSLSRQASVSCVRVASRRVKMRRRALDTPPCVSPTSAAIWRSLQRSSARSKMRSSRRIRVAEGS